jgi:hypothetical protein
MTSFAGDANPHALTRQRAGNKYGFTGNVGNAAAIVAEIGNIGFDRRWIRSFTLSIDSVPRP